MLFAKEIEILQNQQDINCKGIQIATNQVEKPQDIVTSLKSYRISLSWIRRRESQSFQWIMKHLLKCAAVNVSQTWLEMNLHAIKTISILWILFSLHHLLKLKTLMCKRFVQCCWSLAQVDGQLNWLVSLLEV
jgi:hypothetical protein